MTERTHIGARDRVVGQHRPDTAEPKTSTTSIGGISGLWAALANRYNRMGLGSRRRRVTMRSGQPDFDIAQSALDCGQKVGAVIFYSNSDLEERFYMQSRNIVWPRGLEIDSFVCPPSVEIDRHGKSAVINVDVVGKNGTATNVKRCLVCVRMRDQHRGKQVTRMAFTKLVPPFLYSVSSSSSSSSFA